MSLKQRLKEQYAALCKERDRINALNAPIEADLEKANAECEAARVRAFKLAEKIDDNRGRAKWIEMKKDIGTLAVALNKGR